MGLTCDIAIIGGGPGGSTCASLIRKYNPDLSVLVLEKERFPREHVGESQLPLVGAILNEMGCYEKVDAAGFPIKLGATYRWGKNPDLWDFEFIPFGQFKDPDRPTPYTGQRIWTAFQVDRAVYDTILLDHAEELGAEVRQETQVRRILVADAEPDRVAGLELDGGEVVSARHYIDASGHVGVLRRGVGVGCSYPSSLQNVAMWDYWENAQWAVSIGSGGTRVFVLSIGSGWIWFIPIGPTRTSIGFICPAQFYKEQGRSPEDLYAWALAQEPMVCELTAEATREGQVRTTKDWSFMADRMVGPNWFLAGESGGFADPILAGGLMLTHAGARECAYSILELERGELDAAWLKSRYEEAQKRRMNQHIRFADFWYAGNGQFTDLEDWTSQIARDAGVKLDPKEAFRWLSNGGFLDDIPGRVGIGGLDLAATKEVTRLLTDVKAGPGWRLNDYNVFRLNLTGARQEKIPLLNAGRITAGSAWVRGIHTLPLVGSNALLVEVLKRHSAIDQIMKAILGYYRRSMDEPAAQVQLQQTIQVLEVMLIDGWVTGKRRAGRFALDIKSKTKDAMIHENRDVRDRAKRDSGNGEG